jgi:tetrahydromethanopterin S-methyltransferase subunit F
MNTCVLVLGVIESAGKPALRIGFTMALLLLMGAGVFIYGRRDQLFGRDPEVMNDTPVVRHNRLEGIIFVFGGVTLAVLSVLYQLWFG